MKAGSKQCDFPALLIIDMVKDNFDLQRKLPVTKFGLQIIDPINQTISTFRRNNWPVIFSTDAFSRDDFLFESKMIPHSIAGTTGAEVVDELDMQENDLLLPKPRFSAFFQTGLQDYLRQKGVTLCAIGGINTHFCVLATFFDAVCHNFKSVLLEDCSAAHSESVHDQTLELYRYTPLYPLMRVETSANLLQALKG